jgi:hypothetical protein
MYKVPCCLVMAVDVQDVMLINMTPDLQKDMLTSRLQMYKGNIG